MAGNAAFALSIINEFNSSKEYESVTVPETDEGKIEAARNIIEGAQGLFDKGDKSKVVTSILSMAKSEAAWEDYSGIASTYPRRSSGGLSESDEREVENFPKEGEYVHRSDELAVRENLPVPAHIEGDPDVMPRDLSIIDDKQLRKLSGEFNAYLARVVYLLGIEVADAKNCEHLLDAATNDVLLRLSSSDPELKKNTLAKVIEAKIASDPEVEQYRNRLNAHEQNIIVLKSLKEIYSGHVERLSREATMRNDEWKRAHG